jgi:hypothetical protein
LFQFNCRPSSFNDKKDDKKEDKEEKKEDKEEGGDDEKKDEEKEAKEGKKDQKPGEANWEGPCKDNEWEATDGNCAFEAEAIHLSGSNDIL